MNNYTPPPNIMTDDIIDINGIARIVGTVKIRNAAKKLRERHGFPAPVYEHRHKKYYSRPAVLAWLPDNPDWRKVVTPIGKKEGYQYAPLGVPRKKNRKVTSLEVETMSKQDMEAIDPGLSKALQTLVRHNGFPSCYQGIKGKYEKTAVTAWLAANDWRALLRSRQDRETAMRVRKQAMIVDFITGRYDRKDMRQAQIDRAYAARMAGNKTRVVYYHGDGSY